LRKHRMVKSLYGKPRLKVKPLKTAYMLRKIALLRARKGRTTKKDIYKSCRDWADVYYGFFSSVAGTFFWSQRQWQVCSCEWRYKLRKFAKKIVAQIESEVKKAKLKLDEIWAQAKAKWANAVSYIKSKWQGVVLIKQFGLELKKNGD